MNQNQLIKRLYSYGKNAKMVEAMLIYSYIKIHRMPLEVLDDLNECLAGIPDEILEAVCKDVADYAADFSFSHMVELFELLVPDAERKKKGITYTPAIIKDYIIEKMITGKEPPFIIDPSCGCGSFLVSAAQKLHETYGIPYVDIVSKYLYGVDIDGAAIRRAKHLLMLLAAQNGETCIPAFNLVCADMLAPETTDRILKMNPVGFDCVIGNPPYVRSRNMCDVEKKYMGHWNSTAVGNVDLYMPFFEIGLSLLNPAGCLGFISSNGYLQGTNGRGLRKYLSSQKYHIEIVDFRDSQMFKNVTSYTCLTFIFKKKPDGGIDYVRANGKGLIEHDVFSSYSTGDFPDGTPWRMRGSEIDTVIKKLETAGNPLSNWKIRNGLATLKNDIFFFRPMSENEYYYFRRYQGKEYAIEKKICIRVAKPNIIRTEQELVEKSEIAIFPYTKQNNSFLIIPEQELKNAYPMTYSFLMDNKTVLEARDKGRGNYPAWYAYGRTQGMNNFGKKLLIPYIAGSPVAVLSLDENLLFYCGYALFSESEEELHVLKKFLESDVFWYYILHTSKPYSKGYMAFAKNYIVRFSIPELDRQETDYLLSEKDVARLNHFIWSKYDIDETKL